MTDPKMHADEIDVDVDLVARLLAAQLPQWADLPIEPIPRAGTVNALYRLGDDMVVRLPRIEAWGEDVDMLHELLPRLARLLPVAIPVPLARGTPAEDYPWDWAVYRWLPGENPTIGGTADRSLLAKDLAEFVTAMQQVDIEGGSPSFRGTALATRDLEIRRVIDALQGIVDTDAVTAAWEESLHAPEWDGPPVWVHGDLLPDNLLVQNGRLSAVIDFGGVGVGDPAIDVIPAWSVLSSDSRDVSRGALPVDDATWIRGRGWALSIAVTIIPYYVETNPPFVAMAKNMIAEVLADHANG